MILASGGILEHVSDIPWTGFVKELGGSAVTLMSSGIASMILVAALLLWFLPRIVKKYKPTAAEGKLTKSGNALEIIVLFIRDQIAVPSLGKNANLFLPVLLTMFVFVLGMNLIGLTPLQPITVWVSKVLSVKLTGREQIYAVGMSPTGIVSVCVSLAGLTLFIILTSGLWKAARHSSLPLPVALLLSPYLWFRSLAPHVPGVIGKVLAIPLALLELVGLIAKCFSLMVRLAANMVAGHIMLAVLMVFAIDSMQATLTDYMSNANEISIHFFYVAPICVLGTVAMDIMELLVAGLQAYIYTFLTAMFLGLYVEPSH